MDWVVKVSTTAYGIWDIRERKFFWHGLARAAQPEQSRACTRSIDLQCLDFSMPFYCKRGWRPCLAVSISCEAHACCGSQGGLVALFSVGCRDGLGTLSTKQNSLQPASVAGVWETLNRTQRALFMQLLFNTAGGADVLPAQNRVLRYLSAVGCGCSDPADDSFAPSRLASTRFLSSAMVAVNDPCCGRNHPNPTSAACWHKSDWAGSCAQRRVHNHVQEIPGHSTQRLALQTCRNCTQEDSRPQAPPKKLQTSERS